MADEALVVIGVDCASNPQNVGLAVGVRNGEVSRIEGVASHATWEAVDRQLAEWTGTSSLIALDAPLGWPTQLADTLVSHRAGASLPPSPRGMFRRATDDLVAERVGKRPLDVGADRIARTAHSALRLLGRLRDKTEMPIPLAWTPQDTAGVATIEVYPAGTLAGRGLPHSGYKGRSEKAEAIRQRLVHAVSQETDLPTPVADAMRSSDHVLDAVICVLAGCDFADGSVIAPSDLAVAQREGWLWVKTPRPTS